MLGSRLDAGDRGRPQRCRGDHHHRRWRHWTPQAVPPTVGYLSGIACSDMLRCTAVGQTNQVAVGQAVIVATVNGGVSWTQVPAPPGVLDLSAVSCLASGWCMAVGSAATGSVALVSTSSGAAWTQVGALPAGLSGAAFVSCPNAQQCWVAGHTTLPSDHVVGAMALTTDGGTGWITVPTPTGIGSLNGVSCLSGSPTGSGALPVPHHVDGASAVGALGCHPAHHRRHHHHHDHAAHHHHHDGTPRAHRVGVPGVRCTVVGTTADTLNGARVGHGIMITTDNGGATWANQTVATSSASLNGVSCTAIGTCVTVGSTVVTAPQAGLVMVSGSPARPWKSPSVVGSPQPLTAVSCISTSRCVVVGESITEHLVGG